MDKTAGLEKKHEAYRWFYTSKGILSVGGKSDKQNELVMQNFLKPNYLVLHTKEPGSPFMIIQSDNPSKKDIEETAIFCACFSRQWKLEKKEVAVDLFKGSEVYKSKLMKTGTFGVKGKLKTMLVKPELMLVIQKGKLRAVPKNNKEEKLCEIIPGKLSKEQVTEKIVKIIKNKYHFPVSRDEIMSAIPSDKLDIKEH
jgi:hypothetical protein